MAAKPGSNDMLVGVLTVSNYYQTINWVGSTSAWGATLRTVGTSTYGSVYDNRPFDLAFDGSGNALIVYSNSSALYYQTTADITAVWSSANYVDSVNLTGIDCYWVDLGRATDGTVHLACQDNVDASNDRLLAYSWNGSAFSAVTAIQASVYKGPTNHAFKNFALSTQPTAAALVIAQAHYRWRNDNGPEGGSSSDIQTDGTLQTYNTFTTAKVSSYSFSYSVSASASNRLMIVAVSLWPSALSYSVSNVKWNTTESFTKLDVSNSTTEIRTELWYLKNPTAGNRNVVVTFTGSVNCSIGVIAFKGVDQTNTFGTVGKSNSGGMQPAMRLSRSHPPQANWCSLPPPLVTIFWEPSPVIPSFGT
jgi:hypothetical protein